MNGVIKRLQACIDEKEHVERLLWCLGSTSQVQTGSVDKVDIFSILCNGNV